MGCKKVKFESKKDAITALNHIQKFGKRFKYRKECRYYYCSKCEAWHITSKKDFAEESTE